VHCKPGKLKIDTSANVNVHVTGWENHFGNIHEFKLSSNNANTFDSIYNFIPNRSNLFFYGCYLSLGYLLLLYIYKDHFIKVRLFSELMLYHYGCVW